ncbi:MAG: SoxR reducing system RseC family protein [Bacteroidota bacterium]
MELLRHTGIVKAVTPTSLIVSIVNQSACSGCHAKGACNVADMQEKDIEVTRFRKEYKPGNMVTVIFRESSGLKALFLGYILPFLILLLTLIVAIEVTGNEFQGAFIALGMLVPYYIVLFLSKDKLKKAFTFELEETI